MNAEPVEAVAPQAPGWRNGPLPDGQWPAWNLLWASDQDCEV